MRTIILFSSDGRLAGQISQRLTGDERILRLSPQAGRTLPSGVSPTALAVLDCRGLTRSEVETAIVELRAKNEYSFRCVALGNLAAAGTLEVIGQSGASDCDVVFSDCDDTPAVLRAILNDADGSVGTAIALGALRKHLGPGALLVAEAVLSSGCRVSSVGQVESVLRKDRSSLGETLALECSPVPKVVVRIARGTYATVLIRRTHLRLGTIAQRIGFSASRWVQGLLVSEFGARAEELRRRDPDTPIERFLDDLLLRWKTSRVGAEATHAGRQAGRQVLTTATFSRAA